MSAPPLVVNTDSPEQTRALGERIGSLLVGGEVIALIGPLGAGKTQLVKGIAAGNGQTDPTQVTSPSFVLVKEYPGRRYLYHLDAYRLKGGHDLDALGLDEMIGPDSAVAIEWADRVEDALPEDRLTIHIKPTGDTSRVFVLQAGGPSAQRLARRLAPGGTVSPNAEPGRAGQ